MRISLLSLPPRGAWIEIEKAVPAARFLRSRSPRGERGLKYGRPLFHDRLGRSLPPRGAWIEITSLLRRNNGCMRSLPPRGAWIEISKKKPTNKTKNSRSPRGERGLKSNCICTTSHAVGSLPRGERGLKCKQHPEYFDPSGRSPRGERGLKFY